MVLLEMRTLINSKNRKIDDLQNENVILKERIKDLEGLMAKVFGDSDKY